MTATEILAAYANGEVEFIDSECAGADLKGVTLKDAILAGSNFSGADCSGADFSGAAFDNANFQNANLSGANLSGASMAGCNLQNANLSGTNFYLTNLDGTGFEHLRTEQAGQGRELRQEITHTVFLESIADTADGSGEYHLMQGAASQYAQITLRVGPYQEGMAAPANLQSTQVIDAGRHIVLNNCVGEEVIKAEYMVGVADGVKASSGILIGASLTHLQINVVGGRMHEMDSSNDAFKEATKRAIANALGRGKAVLLEPVYKLAVPAETDDENIIQIILESGGNFTGSFMEGDQYFVEVEMPYAAIASLEASLSSSGREPRFSAQFFDYVETTMSRLDAIIGQHSK